MESCEAVKQKNMFFQHDVERKINVWSFSGGFRVSEDCWVCPFGKGRCVCSVVKTLSVSFVELVVLWALYCLQVGKDYWLCLFGKVCWVWVVSRCEMFVSQWVRFAEFVELFKFNTNRILEEWWAHYYSRLLFFFQSILLLKSLAQCKCTQCHVTEYNTTQHNVTQLNNTTQWNAMQHNTTKQNRNNTTELNCTTKQKIKTTYTCIILC